MLCRSVRMTSTGCRVSCDRYQYNTGCSWAEQPTTHCAARISHHVREPDLLRVAEHGWGRHAGLGGQTDFRHGHNIRMTAQDHFEDAMPRRHWDITIDIEANRAWPRRRQYV